MYQKLTKDRAIVALIGILVMLSLTLILLLGVMSIELWFILGFIVFLATDAIIEYRFENRHLRLLNTILVSVCLVIFIALIAHRFLTMLSVLP